MSKTKASPVNGLTMTVKRKKRTERTAVIIE